jgi:hypothetical protein
MSDRELLDWAETIICNALPMPHCSPEEWARVVTNWRDAKHDGEEKAKALWPILVMLKRELDEHSSNPNKLELPKTAWVTAVNRAREVMFCP